LNVQGDEPFVGDDLIAPLVERLRAGAAIATLAAPLDPGRLHERSSVKVVRDASGHALYFSRAPIPGELHLGLYGFSRQALAAVADLPRGRLAAAEDLEQLTWLEAGWRIAVADVPRATLSIDTPEDLAAARALLVAAPEAQ
jgi:3-deoxy-manno-octulosonate cytidylyltransferase (CMP-KDO synthetase)